MNKNDYRLLVAALGKAAILSTEVWSNFGKDGDNAIKGASFNADSEKGVVALVGEGGAWHGFNLVHVVLDVVLASRRTDDSLAFDVAEV